MSVKRNNKSSAATGILSGLKAKQEVVTNPADVAEDVIEAVVNKGVNIPESSTAEAEVKAITVDIYKELDSHTTETTDASLFEQAKVLIAEDTELIRRTFTIESLVHTQLNELKVYIMPVVGGKKKWGYNEIVNIALKEFYEKQKKLLQEKVTK